MEDFPKRKELASLRQLFVLYGKFSIFLYAPPLHAGVYSSSIDVFFWRSHSLAGVYSLLMHTGMFPNRCDSFAGVTLLLLSQHLINSFSPELGQAFGSFLIGMQIESACTTFFGDEVGLIMGFEVGRCFCIS